MRRYRKSKTTKLVEAIERAVRHDLSPTLPTGWLITRHKDVLRAVAIEVGPDEIVVRLQPESMLAKHAVVTRTESLKP